MRGKRQIIRVNQLSDTKVYPHANVNKSITALFQSFGIYCGASKNSYKYIVQFRYVRKVAVLSTDTKSSTFPIVHIAGIFQLAVCNYYLDSITFLIIQL